MKRSNYWRPLKPRLKWKCWAPGSVLLSVRNSVTETLLRLGELPKHFFTWGWTFENWIGSTPPGSFGGKCKTSCCYCSGSRMLLRSAVTRGGVRDSPSLPSRQKRIFSWSPGAPRTSAPQAVTGHGIWGMPERRASETEGPVNTHLIRQLFEAVFVHTIIQDWFR